MDHLLVYDIFRETVSAPFPYSSGNYKLGARFCFRYGLVFMQS
jgi:hypothetical protein